MASKRDGIPIVGSTGFGRKPSESDLQSLRSSQNGVNRLKKGDGQSIYSKNSKNYNPFYHPEPSAHSQAQDSKLVEQKMDMKDF
mmetsp:Transcript_8566/g.13232  ORF Transcript_8566/g.13232 Transcript_8566/m.13232 type:complete len:84 (-) Transcript_8566:175-426(-)